jgi:hypothetical protein
MGFDGYQAVQPALDRSMPAAGGVDYQFTPGAFYRVDAAGAINNVKDQPFAGAHSDIRKVGVCAARRGGCCGIRLKASA